MVRNSLKDRLISRMTQERSPFIKIEQPYTKDKERPSLKGRIHKLPKTAFWQRMSGWPLIEIEPEKEAIS